MNYNKFFLSFVFFLVSVVGRSLHCCYSSASIGLCLPKHFMLTFTVFVVVVAVDVCRFGFALTCGKVFALRGT